jgi:DNA modification methylase
MITEPKLYYSTALGSAYLGDSLLLLPSIPDESVDLIPTSPPFALKQKKGYGNEDEDEYVDWFMSFADQPYRIDCIAFLNLKALLFSTSVAHTCRVFQYAASINSNFWCGLFVKRAFIWHRNIVTTILHVLQRQPNG